MWWPNHDEIKYSGDRMPVWDMRAKGFVDPDTNLPLTSWADAVADLDAPAHVAEFGPQVHSKGILGGTEEAGRHIGYLTKYLVKSIAEVVHADDSARVSEHAGRLAAELAVTPCSDRCAVWLIYGVQPKGTNFRMTPGRCRSKAHRQGNARPARSSGARVAAVVGEDPRRTQVRSRCLREGGARRCGHRQGGADRPDAA